MNRRDLFTNGSLALLGSVVGTVPTFGRSAQRHDRLLKQAKNIIFMVSDGMSTGTLNMTNLLLHRKEGKQSNWLSLYSAQKGRRALMDTASADSLVTDSAASSSSWGGGVRVPNGSLNVGADGTFHKPILQKFKAAGKSVGCVTTVPITHATPAGFCVNNNKRGDQEEIATQYLPLKFDVMMGGGSEYFSADKRKDKQDLFQEYTKQGYTVVRSRDEMKKATAGKPVLGVFHENGLPYSIDRMQSEALQKNVPSIAEMTKQAISILKQNSKGFVMQVEGGKVDWAAHSNDGAALLYDQLAFDEAIKVAVDFAEADKETLVIITTDHGNANPGLFSGDDTNKQFDTLQHFKQSNEWVLKGITKDFTVAQVLERFEAAQGLQLKKEHGELLLQQYQLKNDQGLYNTDHLPYQQLAQLQTSYTAIGWGSMNHSGDYVELAMIGPGSELLKPFVINTELHQLMLQATQVNV